MPRDTFYLAMKSLRRGVAQAAPRSAYHAPNPGEETREDDYRQRTTRPAYPPTVNKFQASAPVAARAPKGQSPAHPPKQRSGFRHAQGVTDPTITHLYYGTQRIGHVRRHEDGQWHAHTASSGNTERLGPFRSRSMALKALKQHAVTSHG